MMLPITPIQVSAKWAAVFQPSGAPEAASFSPTAASTAAASLDIPRVDDVEGRRDPVMVQVPCAERQDLLAGHGEGRLAAHPLGPGGVGGPDDHDQLGGLKFLEDLLLEVGGGTQIAVHQTL